MNSIKPVSIMQVNDVDGVKKFLNRQDIVDNILLHPEVKDRKIVVISIIGEYRKGKSFFLGYCLRYLYAEYSSISIMSKPSSELKINWMGSPDDPLIGFTGKHGRNADTKGIIFWPDFFLHETTEGEKVAIILMDTQGLFEPKSTPDENAKIFGLSTLISSMQIVNLKGEIQENQIEYLEMATNLTKFISQFKKSQWKPFQKLLFLIRDWTDKNIEGGFGYDGGVTYLKEFLEISGRPNPKTQSVRKNIHDSFDIIKCFLLNKPGNAVDNPDFTGEWGELEKGFTENLKALIESLLSPDKLSKKTILGKEVTGAEFRDYINAYFEAFKNAKLPETENIFEMMANNQMKSIVEELIKSYKTSINSDVDFSQENFEKYIDNKHQAAKGEANLKYHAADKIQDAEKILKFQSILLEETEKFFLTWRESAMREHQMHLQHKKQLDDVKNEMKKYQEDIVNLQDSMQQQFKEHSRIQKEMEQQKKEQDENLQKFKNHVEALTLNNQEKEEEMQKLKANLQKQDEENNEKLKELKEADEKRIKIFEAQIKENDKNAKEEHEEVLRKLVERHHRDLEKIKKAGIKKLDDMNRKLKVQQENEKRQSDEQRQQRDKYFGDVNKSRNNFTELGKTIEDENETIGIDILKSIANIVKVVAKGKLQKF